MSTADKNPRHHTTQQAERLRQALFETAAEALTGLEKAFLDYKKGTEPARRR